MKSFPVIALLIVLVGCTVRSTSQETRPTDSTGAFEHLLRAATKNDLNSRRQAAADLCITMLKRSDVWQADPLNWKIPTEEGIKLEVKAVRSSKQQPDLAVSNMCAHCMGMLKSGAWRTAPVTKADSLEDRILDIVKTTEDPVVKTILLVGLASSSTEKARDEVVAATADADLGVRKSANYLVQRCSANSFGPIGVIHGGSPEVDVDAASRKIRAIYRWDKTLGVGWGPMRDGLQTRLVVEPLVGHFGQAISGSLVVRNLSDKPLSVPNKVHPMQYFKVLHNKKYVDRKTDVIPPALPKMTIIPGNQLRVWAFRLDELFSLSMPGDYEVWLPETDGALPPHSNRIQLKMEALNQRINTDQ
ncbi:MAG: hypothetical protein ACYS91_14195 [Planctomycetota bacterium]